MQGYEYLHFTNLDWKPQALSIETLLLIWSLNSSTSVLSGRYTTPMMILLELLKTCFSISINSDSIVVVVNWRSLRLSYSIPFLMNKETPQPALFSLEYINGRERLIFIMGIVILVIRTLYFKTACWSQTCYPCPTDVPMANAALSSAPADHVKDSYPRSMVS